MTFTTIDTTTIDINANTTTEASGTTTTLQNFDSQLSILSDKGFNQKPLNLRLLSKFEGDLEKVEKRLTQIQTNQSSLRECTLNQYQSSLDQLSQRGFSDHPRLPALLKKFDGDVDQIISFIERSSTKTKKDKTHNKKAKDHNKCKGLKNKRRSSSSSPDLEDSTPTPSGSSSIEETSTTSSSSSDPTPSAPTVETLPVITESPIPDQSPKSSNDKSERKAKKEALKQQIRELQGQMKEIKAHNLAQKQKKELKKKERQEKLILREAKILKNLSDLKLKSSKTNEMIQRQEDQLAKVRTFLSVQA